MTHEKMLVRLAQVALVLSGVGALVAIGAAGWRTITVARSNMPILDPSPLDLLFSVAFAVFVLGAAATVMVLMIMRWRDGDQPGDEASTIDDLNAKADRIIERYDDLIEELKQQQGKSRVD